MPEENPTHETTIASDLPSNSATYWFPRIEAVGLPVPRTKFIKFDYAECFAIFDGQKCLEFSRLREAVKAEFTGQPLFIRTDHSSAKHCGPAGYLIDDRRTVESVLFRLLEDHELKFGFSPVEPAAIMVREFLNLKHSFTAFNGLPISREFRFFANPETVFCWHPYWPAGAMERYERVPKSIDPTAPLSEYLQMEMPSDWRDKLAVIQAKPDALESGCLEEAAITAARACCGGGELKLERWSVDFAQTTDGRWFLLDMARARDSWHWPHGKSLDHHEDCE